MDKRTRTWAEIDLSALENNYRSVREYIGPQTRMMCVVKSNAYGHGAVEVARRLEKIGADTLAVVSPDEAFELRDAGIIQKVIILGVSPADAARELIKHGIAQAVTDLDYARELSRAAAGAGKPLKTHLKFDTGMGRLGFQNAEDAAAAMSLPNLDFEGVFSHFASSDEPGEKEYTESQLKKFMDMTAAAEKMSGKKFRVKHCANSGAALAFPDSRLDMARIGLAIYGYSPFDVPVEGLALTPVMSVKTRVAQIKTLEPGDRISYGGNYTSERHGKAAVLQIGYADGLHRSLSGSFEVLIRGKRAAQIGRVCMSMCVADVTDIPGAAAGDEVTIFGKPPAVTARGLADRCGTIPYEILCAVSARVPRITV